MNDNKKLDVRYLQLLAQSFPSVADASTEIINLQAILNLPKGTEHFLADLHGEYEAFQHVLKNASGNIKRKVGELFGTTLRETEKRELCTLIYYPEQKLELVKASEKDLNDWYHITIHHLVAVCRDVSSKYTRSKVRKSLPKDFSYIIQELLHERTEDSDKTAYVNVIIDTIINTGRADAFIIAIANHDMLWMGAAAGNDACICSVIRISLRYANLTTLEEGYGINMVPLATFAMDAYADDPCTEFRPILSGEAENLNEKTIRLTAQMHKAIAVMQFKLEAQLYEKHPEWKMQDRELFNFVDYDHGTIMLEGKVYPLLSCHFPTIDPANPCVLTDDEHQLLQKLHHNFLVSEKLHKHIDMLLDHGCMYQVCNNNLLYHASVPLEEDGSLKKVEVYPGHPVAGMELMESVGHLVRSAFQSDTNPVERDYAVDYFFYLWCGPDSPLFDKSKMATFERYFIEDKETHAEHKGNYFKLRDDEKICEQIMDAFGVTGPNRHIINGHVPVKVGAGENPIKAGGKLMVIDGGFAQAYHKQTGIAGYTLVYHSRGFQLVQHEPFTSTEDAILRGTDIKSTTQIVEMSAHRMLVADTDKGVELRKQIDDLMELLYAYRHGIITPKL